MGFLSISLGAEPAQMETLSSPPGAQRDVSLGNGSLLRLAADSAVGKTGEKDFELIRGAVLIDDASGFGKRGTKLQTQESKLTVRGGTIIAEYQKGSHLKLICVSGEVTIASKSLFKEFIQLKAGQMLVANPAEKFLPEPVPVDLERLIASSPLLGHSSKGLANAEKVDTATQKQRRAVQKGDATKSPLVMAGRGTAVGFDAAFASGSPAFLQVVETAELAANPPVVTSPVRPPVVPPGPPVTPPVTPPGPPVTPPVTPPGPPVTPPVTPPGPPVTPPVTPPITSYTAVNDTTVFDFVSVPSTLKTPGFAMIVNSGDGTENSIQYFRTPYFTFNGTFDFSNFGGEIKFLSTEQNTLFGNLKETSILLGIGGPDADFWSDSNLGQSIFRTTLTVANGSNYNVDFFAFGGNLDVVDSSFKVNDLQFNAHQNLSMTNVEIDTHDTAAITSKTVHISAGESGEGTLTANNLKIGKTEAPTTLLLTSSGQISITNSSQLKALASMSITSSDARINMSGASIQVANEGGSLNMASKAGMDIINSNLSARNIHLEVVGVDGVLHISGGSIVAADVLNLYANSSSGTIRFSGGNVNLTGNTINLRGHTVEIQSGTEVDNHGTTNINATNHLYGIPNSAKEGYGSFKNAVTLPSPP